MRGWVCCLALLLVLAAGCRSKNLEPATLDLAHEACSYCRMIVSDQRFASQIVAPYEEPKFFDDLGCLSNYLAKTTLPGRARMFVADHRTKAWVPAERAVYTRVEKFTAPMGSHFIAHDSADSRRADPDAAAATPVDPGAVFGGHLPAGDNR